MKMTLERPAGGPTRTAARVFRAAALVVLLALTFRVAQPAPVPADGPVPQAPPPSPPTAVRPDAPGVSPLRPQGPTRYSIGDPTDEEQLYLEFINRARANPPREGQILYATTDPDVRSAYTYFSVDLALMTNQFNAIAVAAPLSFNERLIAAARLHTGDMYTNNFQGHNNSWDGGSPGARLTAAGYIWSAYGENVYAYADHVFHGHAGFEVDWGPGPGGMQTPPGHRNSIHGATYREIGVGVINGSNGSVGPQIVTQDFASRNGLTPFITGVVFYDLNGNNTYDLGEGLGGVTVDVAGSSYHAVTVNSGGYSVPVPGNGVFAVIFSATNLASVVTNATVSGNANRKLDLVPVYTPPAVSGPDLAAVGQPNHYTCSPVGAATRYEWRQAGRVPFTTVEGAEDGLTPELTAITSAGYSVIATDVAASGSASFHLAHVQPPVDQVLRFNQSLRPGTSAQLRFASRVGYGMAGQVARVQVSVTGGNSWQDVWSQPGPGQNNPGETTFTQRTVSLSAYAGQDLQVQFVYDYTSGPFYPPDINVGWYVGWYIDDISLTDAQQLTAATTVETTTTALDFTPSAAGEYQIQVRPMVSGRWLSYGSAKVVTATAAPSTIEILSVQWLTGAQFRITFQVSNGTTANFQLGKKELVNGPWGSDSAAILETVVPGSQYRFTTSAAGSTSSFYRVRMGP